MLNSKYLILFKIYLNIKLIYFLKKKLRSTIFGLVGTPSTGNLASLARIYVGISDLSTDQTSSTTFLAKRIIQVFISLNI